jgi:hypothetical protein
MIEMTRRSVLVGSSALAASLATTSLAQIGAQGLQRRTMFQPGELWLDTAGKQIQAHGGSILQVADTFYWYGENKEKTVKGSKLYTWGVRAYASRDLYNWDDLGLIIPPDEMDPTSPLHPSAKLDRPHIIYNKDTKKFVCWIKMLSEPHQTRAVLVADKITGPYTLLRKDIVPMGMGAGDFDLVVSPDDGKAYMYFERVHTEMICADLTDDYTNFSGYYSTHFPHAGPPYNREAPAYFHRRGKHYLATSGTTGYFPNPSEIAVAETYHGPWTVLGDLHPSDRSRTSFNSQISSVFKHPAKKDLYIALADRWTGPKSGADFESGRLSIQVQNGTAKHFGQPVQPLPAAAPVQDGALSAANVMGWPIADARYVWLPIRFNNEGRPTIEWRERWSLDEFE